MYNSRNITMTNNFAKFASRVVSEFGYEVTNNATPSAARTQYRPYTLDL